MRKQVWRFFFVILITVLAIGLLSPLSVSDRDCHPRTAICRNDRQPAPQTPSTDIAWGETGSALLPIAAQIMSVRNPPGVELDSTQKKYLRPLFGNLVDRVKITYNAQLLDRWSHDGKETHIGGVDSIAQTYCDRIYLRDSPKPNDTDRLVLLAHELTHAQQCQAFGGLSQFGFQYFQGYQQAGQSYEHNPLEKSARANEGKFARQLCRSLRCPPISGRYYPNYKGFGLDLPVKLPS
jgi:Domain of unknown function (DUF4157)